MIVRKESLTPGLRFRKRDKALFYGRKMLRKVRSISGQVRNSGQGRKRKMVMKFARRLLQLKKENEAEQLKVKNIFYNFVYSFIYLFSNLGFGTSSRIPPRRY